ncbi:hypothetical protein C8R45DRAFT_1073581 [Mycena sanguinolenta]|nr:hypothetical protein C8R45DRAFT_1073581 [Mycena sanguinolenta]
MILPPVLGFCILGMEAKVTLTRKGKEAYCEEISSAGVTGLTVVKAGFVETVANITETEVKFKFIDAEGLRAILVDGSKPQANALGAYLVTRNRPHLSGVYERDPKLILPHILRTCVFYLESHCSRPLWKILRMAKVVPDEPMGWIRRCPYFKTQQEVDEFVQWCKDSEFKVFREIPEDDWYLTPGDTNLNESAHPYTNRHTGTNLLLLEAIESKTKKSAILVNHRNTKTQRDRNNAACCESHRRQAVARSEARTELEDLTDAIERSAAEMRQLREKTKALQSSSGVKQTRQKGEKAKEHLPDLDLEGLEEAGPASIQKPPQYTLLTYGNSPTPSFSWSSQPRSRSDPTHYTAKRITWEGRWRWRDAVAGCVTASSGSGSAAKKPEWKWK